MRYFFHFVYLAATVRLFGVAAAPIPPSGVAAEPITTPEGHIDITEWVRI